jgi:sugar phosphate isomerase/epimerase
MKMCLNRGTTGGSLPLEAFVSLAAASGFGGADVDLGYALDHGTTALRDLYASKKMAFGGWGPPVDFRGDAGKMSEGLLKLEKMAEIAQELSIDSCATYLLPSSDLPLGENWKFHIERIKPIAKVLADQGLRFGLEFVAPYHLRRKWAHEFLFTPGQVLELADAIGPNVGLLVDCFHCHCAGTPWAEVGKLPREKIVLVHLNDAPNVPLADVEDGKRLLPGDGVLDLKAFLQALKAAGYTGPVAVEVFNEELRKWSPEVTAKKAGEATMKIARTAGVA